MVDKIKPISNPLTIIAIFSGLAEVAGTIALPLVQQNLQIFFIWYVMGLPVLLVALFFATLNFNPKVLYSPSDYENEENFMKNVLKQVEKDKTNQSIQNELQTIKEQIGAISQANSSKTQIEELRKNVVSLEKLFAQSKIHDSEDIDDSTTKVISTNSAQQAKIYSFLLTNGGQTISSLSTALGISSKSITASINRLLKRKLITKTVNPTNGNEIYSI